MTAEHLKKYTLPYNLLLLLLERNAYIYFQPFDYNVLGTLFASQGKTYSFTGCLIFNQYIHYTMSYVQKEI